jgi:hypothetical protein
MRSRIPGLNLEKIRLKPGKDRFLVYFKKSTILWQLKNVLDRQRLADLQTSLVAIIFFRAQIVKKEKIQQNCRSFVIDKNFGND